MRGTRKLDLLRPDVPRIIPAHAGNTRGRNRNRLHRPDHPRACGEHWRRRKISGKAAGSSPRMRGTRRLHHSGRRRRRIIPAHAGNTAASREAPGTWPDHPRACGEHEPIKAGTAAHAGSSPRMRGTHASRARYGGKNRIIPAHAGNTRKVLARLIVRTDHPRACGEHVMRVIVCPGDSGSSPRMRGTHALHKVQLRDGRIIPAHAGNTRRKTRAVFVNADHPRACGEHDTLESWLIDYGGSSPRMRGTPWNCMTLLAFSRIIPAHAGNTHGASTRHPVGPDHPRACGEHASRFHCWRWMIGSSPRMRGTPLKDAMPTPRPRIIPAHAGNTAAQPEPDFQVADHPRACGEHPK